MPGRAKSMARKAAIDKQEHDALMARAVSAYLAELEKPNPRSRRGLRTICKDFEKIYYNEKGVTIHLSYCTLNRLADGHKTREQATAHRRWLTDIEEDIVVNFVIEMAAQGWPVSHRRLKEHVDLIAGARLGDEFPSLGVGKNWTSRFILRHSNRIKMSDSRPLEDKRSRAVNPTANKHYWELIECLITKYGIREETTFGSDEVGVQSRGNERERVATSSQKKGPQYQQRAGTQENTTVIVTICADGTATPPTVIFKGAAYQVSWGDDNPLNASIGYQKKGWTSGEIGAEWIKIFDKQTKHKVEEGEHRLLLVDGHNSHYTVDFLLYAREHLILVVCYIPHSTHIYQGLDVVIFSPLKKMIGDERDKWLREKGAAMDKNNFLTVYGRAHVRALTHDNIKAAFQKTGIWPFNPNIVTADMLAPSKSTSSEAHLPSPPNDPAVDILAMMFQKLARVRDDPQAEVVSEDPIAGPSNPTKFDVINDAVRCLSETDFAHLLSPTLTTSNDKMPSTIPQLIHLPQPSPLLTIEPRTETEAILLAALREYQNLNQSLTNRNIALQSHNLLNEVYCGNAKGALQFQEKKKQKKGQGTLTGGLACLVTGDEFYEARVNMQKESQVEEQAKATRKDAKVIWQAAVEEWKEAEKTRKELKISETEKFKVAMAAWKAANGRGNGRGRGRGRGGGVTKTAKPIMATIPPATPRPLLKNFTSGRNIEGEESENEEFVGRGDERASSDDDEETGNDNEETGSDNEETGSDNEDD